jgi:uncharacterized protein (TIGR02996 family)
VLAFLAAVREDPDDDTPRLILADWLDENGTALDVARAELLRLQCRSPRVRPSLVRQKQLLDQFAQQWRGPLGGVFETWTCQRGLWHARASADVLLSATTVVPPGAFAWVEGLTVSGLSAEQARQLANSPWLSHLLTLDLERRIRPPRHLGDEGVMALTRSPYLISLRSLFLRAHDVGDAGASALAQTPGLPRLSVLSLAGNPIRDVGAQALAASPLMDRLRVLNLEGHSIGHLGMPALRAAAAARPGLWIYVGRGVSL